MKFQRPVPFPLIVQSSNYYNLLIIKAYAPLSLLSTNTVSAGLKHASESITLSRSLSLDQLISWRDVAS